MSRVVRSAQAQQDLEEILDYLDAQSGDASDRLAVKFDESCEHYAKHPQIGASATEYAPNLRCFTVWNYAIFYRSTADGIELIRIIHGARDIPKRFE